MLPKCNALLSHGSGPRASLELFVSLFAWCGCDSRSFAVADVVAGGIGDVTFACYPLRNVCVCLCCCRRCPRTAATAAAACGCTGWRSKAPIWRCEAPIWRSKAPISLGFVHVAYAVRIYAKLMFLVFGFHNNALSHRSVG